MIVSPYYLAPTFYRSKTEVSTLDQICQEVSAELAVATAHIGGPFVRDLPGWLEIKHCIGYPSAPPRLCPGSAADNCQVPTLATLSTPSPSDSALAAQCAMRGVHTNPSQQLNRPPSPNRLISCQHNAQACDRVSMVAAQVNVVVDRIEQPLCLQIRGTRRKKQRASS